VVSVVDIEQELAVLSRKHARHVKAAREIEPERDALIRRALADQVPRRRVVEITGLSPQRVDQIRRSSRI